MDKNKIQVTTYKTEDSDERHYFYHDTISDKVYLNAEKQDSDYASYDEFLTATNNLDGMTVIETNPLSYFICDKPEGLHMSDRQYLTMRLPFFYGDYIATWLMEL